MVQRGLQRQTLPSKKSLCLQHRGEGRKPRFSFCSACRGTGQVRGQHPFPMSFLRWTPLTEDLPSLEKSCANPFLYNKTAHSERGIMWLYDKSWHPRVVWGRPDAKRTAGAVQQNPTSGEPGSSVAAGFNDGKIRFRRNSSQKISQKEQKKAWNTSGLKKKHRSCEG